MVKKILIAVIKIVLYVVFVVAAVYYTPKILSKVLHTQYPLATITSGSMWPVLKVNDLILMKGISGNQAQIGQIIIYQNTNGFTPLPQSHNCQSGNNCPENLTTTTQTQTNAVTGFTIHRLIRKQDGKLITQGDANDVEDAPIAESQVIGRIVYVFGNHPFRIPYLGFIARNLGPTIQDLEKK
jgi:signal peptidase I